MASIRLIIAALVLTGIAAASDLSDLRDHVYRGLTMSASGVAQLNTTSVDSLIGLTCRDFHLSYPDALVKLDTISLLPGVLNYALNDDVLDVPGINPITFCCYIDSTRINPGTKVAVPLHPITSDEWYLKTIAEPNASAPDVKDDKQYAFTAGGRLFVYPVTRFDDMLILEYRAVQPVMDDTTTFQIHQAYYEKFIQAVISKARDKLGLN